MNVVPNKFLWCFWSNAAFTFLESFMRWGSMVCRLWYENKFEACSSNNIVFYDNVWKQSRGNVTVSSGDFLKLSNLFQRTENESITLKRFFWNFSRLVSITKRWFVLLRIETIKFSTCFTLCKLAGTSVSAIIFLNISIWYILFEEFIGLHCLLTRKDSLVLFLLSENTETFCWCLGCFFLLLWIARFQSWLTIWWWCWRTFPFSQFVSFPLVFGGWLILWVNLSTIFVTTNWLCLMRVASNCGFCWCIHWDVVNRPSLEFVCTGFSSFIKEIFNDDFLQLRSHLKLLLLSHEKNWKRIGG